MREMDDLLELLERPDGPTVSGSSATFQSLKRVFQRGEDNQRAAARMLLIRSGVWMPVDVYRNWPVLLPWVIRRNGLGNHEKGRASKATGLRLDDNAPVGKLKTNLPVSWGGRLASTFQAKPLKQGGGEWWQCHCWSGLAADPTRSTSTHPLTNSFVPNLVWLPYAIGRLTDDETLIFKDELRSIAWARYRNVRVAPGLAETVERAWERLDEPQSLTVPADELALVNEFQVGQKFYKDRLKYVGQAWSAVNALLDDPDVDGLAVTPKTYAKSLRTIPHSARLALRDQLEPFAQAARQFEMPATADSSAKPGKKATHLTPTSQSTGKAVGIYTVTTPTHVFPDLPCRTAALRVIQSVLEAGVDPDSVKELLLGKFRMFPGMLVSDNLWEAMQASGISGPIKNWFISDPIHLPGETWVVDANGWSEGFAAKKLPALCALSGGAVSVSVV